MPTRDLFDPSSQDDILSRVRKAQGSAMYHDFKRAEEYGRGVMLHDVERELLDRYPDTQTGSSRGTQVQPNAIPLAQKFADELATLYTGPYTQELVNQDGEVAEEPTEQLRRMQGEAGYAAAMHRVERRVLLEQSCGLWHQPRAGKLRLVSQGPHRVDPIPPDERTWFHPGDQDDYQALLFELQEPGTGGRDEGQYAYVERAQVAFYSARAKHQPGMLDVHANPFLWPQTFDTDDMRGVEALLPLTMATAWHDRSPDDAILPDADIPIVDLNRELNIQWSMLLDTIGHQGWTQMAATVMDPANPPSTMQMGPRNVIVLGVGEALQAIDSATNYAGLVSVLQSFVQLLANTKGLNPSDFALDRTAPASGFAKLLDMLPRINARQKFGARMAAQEATLAWPRLAVIGRHLGYFSASVEQLAALRLRTKYADIEIPQSVDEESKRHEFDLKHGLTTPARILAEREGITAEEAQQRIDENKAAMRPPAPAPGASSAQPDARSGRAAGLLGSLIGNRAAPAARDN